MMCFCCCCFSAGASTCKNSLFHHRLGPVTCSPSKLLGKELRLVAEVLGFQSCLYHITLASPVPRDFLQPEVFVQAATLVRKRLVADPDSTSNSSSSGPKRRRWARVILEKPFGSDRASSNAMQSKLEPLFCETELYRIDHYLGKELVENILVLRLANQVFSPLWCAVCGAWLAAPAVSV